MQSFLHSISAVLVIFLLAGTGYLLARAGWLQSAHKPMLSRITINLGVPCICIHNITGNFTRASLIQAAPMLLAPLTANLLSVALCMLAARLLALPRKRWGVFVVMASFSNTIFIGLPMALELFGDGAVPYVMCYYLINTTLFQTLGIAFLEWSGQGENRTSLPRMLLGLLKKPPLLSLFVALGLVWWEIPLPRVLESYAGYVGNLVAPLGLLYTGLVIYERGLSNLRLQRGIPLMLLLRFVAAPGLCLGFCHLLGVTGMARGVFTMESALPTMTQSVVLSGLLGADEDYAALGAAISTLLSFVMIPLVMLAV